MAKKNIPTFIGFVITMLCFARVAAAENSFRPFFLVGSDVLATTAEDIGIQPQLRVSGELGLAFAGPEPLRPSLAFGCLFVEPSIPAASILYRGYYGPYLAAALDFQSRGKTAPFLSFGASCALARYSHTELYFLAYAVQTAPGLSIERERLELRLSLPLRAEFRGDGKAFSAGLALAIAKLPRKTVGGSR